MKFSCKDLKFYIISIFPDSFFDGRLSFLGPNKITFEDVSTWIMKISRLSRISRCRLWDFICQLIELCLKGAFGKLTFRYLLFKAASWNFKIVQTPFPNKRGFGMRDWLKAGVKLWETFSSFATDNVWLDRPQIGFVKLKSIFKLIVQKRHHDLRARNNLNKFISLRL